MFDKESRPSQRRVGRRLWRVGQRLYIAHTHAPIVEELGLESALESPIIAPSRPILTWILRKSVYWYGPLDKVSPCYIAELFSPRFAHAKIESLVPGKEYQFRVIAENLNGRGDPCEPSGTIKTEESAPSKRGFEGQYFFTFYFSYFYCISSDFSDLPDMTDEYID